MTWFEEVLTEGALAFGPIIASIVIFGLFRFWQVFIKRG